MRTQGRARRTVSKSSRSPVVFLDLEKTTTLNSVMLILKSLYAFFFCHVDPSVCLLIGPILGAFLRINYRTVSESGKIYKTYLIVSSGPPLELQLHQVLLLVDVPDLTDALVVECVFRVDVVAQLVLRVEVVILCKQELVFHISPT
jgi:hypothetical protein